MAIKNGCSGCPIGAEGKDGKFFNIKCYPLCSACGEEMCEYKYTVDKTKQSWTVRDCQPWTYNFLPNWIKKEMGLI